jgi:hypothetical protein
MSNNRQPTSFGDVLHFLAFLGCAMALWYFTVTMDWPWYFTVGAMIAWIVLMVATLGWVNNAAPVVTLLVLHLLFATARGGYWINTANNAPRTIEIVVCKLFTTDSTASSNIETRIRTNHGDFTLGALKFTGVSGKVTYFVSGANAATAFKIGTSYEIMHKGGHWGASNVVKKATELDHSVGACKN